MRLPSLDHCGVQHASLRLERPLFLAVKAQDEDADVAQVPAGDGEARPSAEGRASPAALPRLGRQSRSWPEARSSDIREVVLDEDDSICRRATSSLRALGDELLLRPSRFSAKLPEAARRVV